MASEGLPPHEVFGKGIIGTEGFSGAAGGRSGVLKNAASNIFN